MARSLCRLDDRVPQSRLAHETGKIGGGWFEGTLKALGICSYFYVALSRHINLT